MKQQKLLAFHIVKQLKAKCKLKTKLYMIRQLRSAGVDETTILATSNMNLRLSSEFFHQSWLNIL